MNRHVIRSKSRSGRCPSVGFRASGEPRNPGGPLVSGASGRGSLTATTIGGVLFGLAFPPTGFWPLAWGAMIPLFLAAARLPRDRAFVHGLAFFLPGFGIPYHWVAFHPMATPALVTTAALVAVAVSAAAMIALFAGVGAADANTNRPAARIIAAAACLLSFEQILLYGPVPFPSAVSGYAMADAVWMDAVVRTAGLSGVSLLLVGTSAAASIAVLRRPERRARHLQAVMILAAFLAGWISGPAPGADPSDSDDTLRVTLVQPALSPDSWARVDDAERTRILERRMTALIGLLAPGDPGLVILPETALPEPALAASGSSSREWLRSWSIRLGTPVLAGAIIPANDATPDGSFTNSALISGPELSGTADPGRYDKQILVPFAERVPFVGVLPFLGALSVPAGGVSRYERGLNEAPLESTNVRLGLLICFESLFPHLARTRVRDGADVLVVLTQDGWWGSNAARRQHLLYSRMRAVESGVPLIQVSVDGESGVFDHHGRLRVVLDSGVPAARSLDIPLLKRTTLFSSIGDAPVHILLALLLIGSTALLFGIGQFFSRLRPAAASRK